MIARLSMRKPAGRSEVGAPRKAVTILEFLIWTGLVAVVLGGAGLYSLTARNQSKANATISQIHQVRNIVDSLYPSQNYANLTTDQVAMGMPDSAVQGTSPSQTIITPFGGSLGVHIDGYTGSYANYWVDIAGLPKEACVALALANFNGNVPDVIYVNSVLMSQPVTTVKAIAMCTSANGNTYSLRYSN